MAKSSLVQGSSCVHRRKNGRCGRGDCSCRFYGMYGVCQQPRVKTLSVRRVKQAEELRQQNPEFQIRSMPKGYGPHRDGRILR